MVFWQLTIDAHDPPRLVAFWAEALGYTPTPPDLDTPWYQHYRGRLGGEEAFDNRLFDPAGEQPPLWFQEVPEDKAGKNRLHIDVYATDRDDSLTLDERVALVDAVVARLSALGATTAYVTREDDPDDFFYFVTMRDPEGNEFCVS
ncbi:MAG: VOC family protein [Candidatus Nanopelagicales bacterium]